MNQELRHWMGMALVAVGLSLNHAEASEAPPAGQGQCAAVSSRDFAGLPDAPTQIIASKVVESAAPASVYCQVLGYVTPGVSFELRLPLAHWNGKLLQFGCGGFCGSTEFFIRDCDDPLRKGYACIASDNGHRSTMSDALWAYNNLQAEIDHGYRAAHVVALAGKAITGSFYGAVPRRAYFQGCSTGGRQAMIEAQRFPWDFDGIIAGAPSLSVATGHMDILWNVRALTTADGQPRLTAADLDLVHDAVLARCDLDDGVKDGIVSNPRACTFDPAVLACKAGKSASCLRPDQVTSLQKVYAGPATSAGEKIHGGVFPGAELTMVHDADTVRGDNQFVANEFRYSAFQPNAGPAWQVTDFDFDRDYQRFGMSESLSAATNPDLRKFKAAGGKLISYVGLLDHQQAYIDTDYYDTVERTMGGREPTHTFFRAFVMPGVEHCEGGAGAYPTDADYLRALEAWVEQGQAPEYLIGKHFKGTKAMTYGAITVTLPDPASPVAFTRPIYPYPQRAHYKGSGDPNDAANFEAREP